MRRGILLLLIFGAISGALLWYFWCQPVRDNLATQQRQDDNDACVKPALNDYKKRLGALTVRLHPGFKIADDAMPQEKNERAESARTEKFVIPIVIRADEFRKKIACDYLPYKIDGGMIQNYPDKPSCPLGERTSSYAPSPSKTPPRPKPTPVPPPDSIKDNGDQILVLAKSVGRLGIRRTGSSYTQFWGTGFLVTNSTTNNGSDVVVTACHVMDPIMKVEDGKHHLHLDGEELVIDFKYYDGEDYDYQCPIKDVLTCSSQEGVDVALLSLDTQNCTGTGALPSGATLDINEPKFTVSKTDNKAKMDTCTAGPGKSCLAMIAYADIDHPIDEPTNELYGVYYDKDYSDFQFVMNDDVATVEECPKEPNVEIMMDVGTTTVGESGGVLTYFNRAAGGGARTDPHKDPLIVSGMHTCCSAFFNYKYETPPASNTACAHLRRTLDNQAISTWSMLKDHDICTGLKDHHALPEGYNCP